MLFGKSNDRIKKIVVYTVSAAFVLSTGIIGVYALMSRPYESAPYASASDIAVVNGKGIGYYEFLENYRYMYQQYPFFSPGESEYWLRSFVLDQIIAGELVKAEAERAGIKVGKAEIDEVIESQKALYANVDDYYLYLQSIGMTEADLREAVKANLMVEAYIKQLESGATVSDEEVAAEFEARKAEDEALVFEEVQDEVRSDLLEEKKNELLVNHINELMAAAKIEIKDPVINAIRAAEAEDWEKAAAHYQEAIDEDQADPYLRMAFARVLEKLDRGDEAIAAYERAAEVDEGVTAEVQLVLGMAYQDRGMSDKAVEAFRKASEIDGETDGYLHTMLKSEFEALGLDEDAAREQEIIDRIAEEMARQEEEYQKMLEEYLKSLESEQTEGDSSEETSEAGDEEGSDASQ